MIEITGLSFSYSKQGRRILDDVSLRLLEGEIGALLGPNGSGKTTLFSLLTSQRKYTSGSIKLNGAELMSLSRKERAQLLSFVPQISIVQSLSIYDTIMLGRLPYYAFAPSQKDKEIVEDVIEELGLTSLALASINEVSGGERQKAIIGIALAQQSRILILDEPMNNLDVKAQSELLGILENLAKTRHIAILFSTHDIAFAFHLANRFFILANDGKMISGGKELLTTETLSDIYGCNVIAEEYNHDFIIKYGRNTK